MKKLFFILIFYSPLIIEAQNMFIGVIISEDKKVPIEGATVRIKKLNLSVIANAKGYFIFDTIPNGAYKIEITAIGFKEAARVINFPVLQKSTFQIFLEPDTKELDEVIVSSTRANRRITSTPTRVEVIAEEEVKEEATMRPGDIRMLLSESTGIQTQQTSATSANASIRIQGLDGRYTQILKDGFPIYSGAANGLGLLQTPPLDLRQVEIIKGSSSTLYGGGAIAGLINLITKFPTGKKELSFNINGTSAGGLDINGFYSQKFKVTGVTMFISRNSNKAYDPANISLTAIPKFERYTMNPKVFLYFNDKSHLSLGVNTTFENRTGGDINYIEGRGDSTHNYFEKNKTGRLSTQFDLEHKINDASTLSIKNSVGYFNRIINSKNYIFRGTQYSTFTEASYVHKIKKSDWVAGLNLLTDHFTEVPSTQIPLRNYGQSTFGSFVQNTWNASHWLTFETGLRGDCIRDYGFALLPRISLLFKISPELTSRIGSGWGYKEPTIFTEESEKLLYKNVLPVKASDNKLERSYGANWDINYKANFGKLSFSFNQFFFFTYLNHPLSLVALSNGLYNFTSIAGHINSKGAETNIKIGYDEAAVYLGYTYTDVEVINQVIRSMNPLTPKHRFNAALVYEVENKWKVGSELYYFSKQKLSDGSTGKDYWLSGLVAERLFRKISIYINFENFGDVRQTRFESIYTGTITNPIFKDIYAPLEGFIVNGGFKFKF